MVCLQRRKSFHFGLRTTLLNTGKQRSPASDIFFYFTFDQWEDILLFVAPFLAPDSDPPTPEFWSFPGADYVPFWESFVRNLSWHFLPLLLKSRWQSWHFFQNTYGILDSIYEQSIGGASSLIWQRTQWSAYSAESPFILAYALPCSTLESSAAQQAIYFFISPLISGKISYFSLPPFSPLTVTRPPPSFDLFQELITCLFESPLFGISLDIFFHSYWNRDGNRDISFRTLMAF